MGFADFATTFGTLLIGAWATGLPKGFAGLAG
jgi:hypothetical protein